MSDYNDWHKDSVGVCLNTSHAAHKPLQRQEKCSASKASRASMMAALRDSVGLEPAEPKRIDTTVVESELEAMPVIERGSDD